QEALLADAFGDLAPRDAPDVGIDHLTASRNRSVSVGRSTTSLTTLVPGPRSVSTVPDATSRPSLMIATASHSRSTRSSWWLEKTTGTPVAAYSFRTPESTS